MANTLMSGFWRYMLAVPPFLWEKQIHKARLRITNNLSFMTASHRRVHHFVVRELPREGRPLSAAFIAEELHIREAQVVAILEELETHMTFLFRNETGAVIWAYPLTTAPTPHRITFTSGEQLYAA
ncbi:MAG: hypothetical protein HF981_15240 [Desulfobacteraceae bacterium]|nr:hypothetical protein [Desulfobacteraceae bacterium]MBC2751742.1 hypothetical protein [Desulfobacteraceae bacterium]